MSDARVLNTNKELEIDDKDYLIKLLSKLRIVKWLPPQSLGYVGPHPKQLTETQVDYTDLPYMKFIPGGLSEITPEPINQNPNVSKVLNLFFPTEEWIENGEKFRKKISTAPATRLETARLNDGIKALMILAQARPTGICSIRENLTLRCFDEMIRLATIDSGERGLLMRTVQDEIRMTMTCYKTLLDSAIDFGGRKFHEVLHTMDMLHHEVESLTKEKQRYQFENQEMRIKIRQLNRKNTEERLILVESRKHKLSRLKRTNDQFIAILDMIGVDKNSYRHLI